MKYKKICKFYNKKTLKKIKNEKSTKQKNHKKTTKRINKKNVIIKSIQKSKKKIKSKFIHSSKYNFFKWAFSRIILLTLYFWL